MTGQVRQERTGWRDQEISLRHRLWGYDCPAVDVDFLVIEYDCGKAAALVEYKRHGAGQVQFKNPSIMAITDLADRAELPAFVAYYATDFSWWYPIPLNSRGGDICVGWEYLTERQWVEILYRCRGRQVPEDVLAKIREVAWVR
ncbi:MAG: hypothetical protein HZA50_10080 [Planctomycetes bacterium]|nr:hypothetical protein [Planctomycetota bacterium]